MEEQARAEMTGWRTFPAQQLRGQPTRWHAYVGRERPEQTCCKRFHLSVELANICAGGALHYITTQPTSLAHRRAHPGYIVDDVP
jgi:hypothetical protein